VTTITPYRSDLRPGRDGFAQLLHAEWTKFRTVRGWIIAIIIAVLASGGIGLLTAGSSETRCLHAGSNGQAAPGAQPRSGGGCVQPFPNGPGGEPVTDSFYFAHQPLSGDGSITVRLTSMTGLLPSVSAVNATAGQKGFGPPQPTQPGLEQWAKAGVIIKASLRQGSAYAAMMAAAGHGVRMQWNYTADTPGLSGAVGPASPRWLRLTRAGDVITGYDSADGANWTRVGTVTLPGLPATVQAGLFAASPDYSQISQTFGSTSSNGGPTQATGVFDHVTRTGGWPASAWTGEYLGGEVGPGIGGYHQAGGQFTVTGSGDIAPIWAGHGGDLDSALTVSDYLLGTFAGLIAIVVVAAMFITGEYRRNLIRTTLAASPRRGRVLAAKAIVIGAVSFVAGLTGAAAAVLAGGAITRHRGYYEFPVQGTTELRVIIGTGVLVALAAVLVLAVGTMVRRSAATVAIAIVAIVVPYFLAVAAFFPLSVSDWLLRITPAAGFALQQASPAYTQVAGFYAPRSGYYPLAPWAGLTVLAAWTAVALAAAVCLLRRRDA
jgi:ABC-type transport system involved in multi-copper enzyme maturation permease subunit